MPQHQARDSTYALPALLALLCILMLASCSTSTSSQANHASPRASRFTYQQYASPINRPVVTTGCGQASPIAPGTSGNLTLPVNPAISAGHSSRSYRVHVPAAYNTHQPLAAVLVFHGHGGTAAGMEGGSGFSTLAEQQHFIAVYPQGLPDGYSGEPFWASAGPIDFGIDDVHFVSDMLNDLQKKFCIDSRRLYATGFSNGGGMSWLLACRLAGRIAAFAPISGNFYAIPGGCHPGRPVPILDMHGTADPVLPYNGIPSSKNPAWPLPSIPQWLQTWASWDSCTKGPTIFLRQSNVSGEQWAGCQGNAAVVHYRIEGGGHHWPPTIGNRSPADVIWLFFQAHPLG